MKTLHRKRFVHAACMYIATLTPIIVQRVLGDILTRNLFSNSDQLNLTSLVVYPSNIRSKLDKHMNHISNYLRIGPSQYKL